MPLAASEIPAAPVVIFMAFGVLLAMFGHAAKSRGTVATGLLILFVATGAMFLGAYAAFEGDERDPRPPCDETVQHRACEKPNESPSERPRKEEP
jgi:hypothetical protein